MFVLRTYVGSITIRIRSDGKKLFDAAIKKRGFPRRWQSFERLTDARAWVQDVESEMRAGRFSREAELTKHTLGEAIDRYVADDLPRRKPRSYRRQKTTLLWFKKHLGYRLLAEVTPAALVEAKGVFFREISRRNCDHVRIFSLAAASKSTG